MRHTGLLQYCCVILYIHCLYTLCSAVIGCIIAPLHSMLVLSTSYSTVPYSVFTDPRCPHKYTVYIFYTQSLYSRCTTTICVHIGPTLSWVPLLYMPIVLLLLLLLIAYGHSYRDSFINSPSPYIYGVYYLLGVSLHSIARRYYGS